LLYSDCCAWSSTSIDEVLCDAMLKKVPSILYGLCIYLEISMSLASWSQSIE